MKMILDTDIGGDIDDALASRIEPVHVRVEHLEGAEYPRTMFVADTEPNVDVVTAIDKVRFDGLFAQRIVQ